MAACISECGLYRYWLFRDIEPGNSKTLTVCMLNPSTADHTHNDPTIKMLMAYCAAWGFGKLQVVNAYAYRATDPKDLLTVADPVGPDNDQYLKYIAQTDNLESVFVAAWGTKITPQRQAEVVRIFLHAGIPLHYFELNVGGTPKHPLYVRRDQPLTFWMCDGII